MENWELIFFIIKLALGGITSFLAIMLWSKTRDAALMSLVAAVVTFYAGIVYDMMLALGIVSSVVILGIPIFTLLFAVVPQVFFICAFVMMVWRNR